MTISDGLCHRPRCGWATAIKTRRQAWIHFIFSSSKVPAFKSGDSYATMHMVLDIYSLLWGREDFQRRFSHPSQLLMWRLCWAGRGIHISPCNIFDIFRRTMIQILLKFSHFWNFQAHDVSSIKCSQPLTGRYVTLQVEVEHLNFWWN